MSDVPEEGQFDESWQSLISLLRRRPAWHTLVRDVEARATHIDEDYIEFETDGAAVEKITKRRLENAWERIRDRGEYGPGFRTAVKALVAQLPNIEWERPGLRLHWVDPPTHALGEPRQWGATANVHDPTDTSIESATSFRRTRDMWLAAYFLARCGRTREGRPPGPPPQLEVRSWSDAYALFFPKLGAGRPLAVFANSLKNARDQFDAHLDRGRVGWRDPAGVSESRAPRPLQSLAREVFDEWQPRTDEQLWAAVKDFAVVALAVTPPGFPNARFDADAERWRAFRVTPEYLEVEVDYKASLQAVLRRALSHEALQRRDLADFLQRVLDRRVDPDELGLSSLERSNFQRWNYKQSWINLNGGPQGATPILGALHAWVGDADRTSIADMLDDLIRGPDSAPSRIQRFCTALSAAFKDLHAVGKLKSTTAPRMSLTFAASILGLIDPDHCTLWRSDTYRRAAEDFGFVLPSGGATAADKYAASIAMQLAIRDALRGKGIEVRDLLEVHDFLWVREKTWKVVGSDSEGEKTIAGILGKVAASAGLWFEPWVVEDLYLALRTKPFLILTGLSGTGKTKVAMALQELLCDPDTRAFVSVRPDWVDSKSLLGYHNLLTDKFVATKTTTAASRCRCRVCSQVRECPTFHPAARRDEPGAG